ncbi:Os01g0230700 [Oryza sativa Japonica Group]|uniref:Os01g0230700 protein n=1 Tax=Oryza sativa subsp. japonica TaxID=39947 RepID=A0A0P0V0N8_ORYSJ|nr:hypothetical protein EE612_001246 [Oryza sativa]BAS71168.1 Os01g0230700 [Oryza sativa Japonica Group]
MGTEEKKHRQQSRSRSRRKDVTGKGSRCEVASKASEDGRVQKRHKQGYTRTTLPSFPLLYVLDRPTLQPDASLAAAFHPCLPACTRSSARSSELIARCCCACGFGGVGQVGEYERCHSVRTLLPDLCFLPAGRPASRTGGVSMDRSAPRWN